MTVLSLIMAAGGSQGAAPVGFYRESRLNATNQNDYTFSAVNIGTAAADRLVVVAATVIDPPGTQSCTIGGNPATLVVEDTAQSGVSVAIYSLVVTTGTTADITIDHPGGQSASSAAISVYSLYPASTTPVDSVNNSGDSVGSITASDVAVSAGGMTIAVAGGKDSTANAALTPAWTGADAITTDDSQTVETNNVVYAGHINNSAASTLDDFTVTSNSGNQTLALAIASWGPLP